MSQPPVDDAYRLRRALTTIQDLRARLVAAQESSRAPVAIVGMACRFPGARDVDGLWRLLESGTDAIGPIPSTRRWDHDPVDALGLAWRPVGGFLEDIEGFDHRFFGISPREARAMDPQQRMLLEEGWHALESSGIAPGSLAGTRTGVFVGIAESEFTHAGTGGSLADLTGRSASVAAGRLAYQLGLRGPALAVDTACSSSLVALHLAVRSLRAGECDLALVAGVNALLSPDTFSALGAAGALAPDGRCKTFDAAADGYGRGEGCGVLVLQRLADAEGNRMPVRAVVRGSAIGQDGRTNGLTAPSGQAQQDVVRAALADAGVEPDDIRFVETHGTGTRLGDPVEVDALTAVFAKRTAPLPLTAVKPVLGHLECAAGVAGVIKAVLVLAHQRLPGAVHLHRLNPLVAWDQTPVHVPTGTTALAPGAAGVSSFGFSGTNAHVVLSPPPEASAGIGPRPTDEGEPRLLTLSARTAVALDRLAADLVPVLEQATDSTSFAEVCAATGSRASEPVRLALVATSGLDAATRLGSACSGGRRHGVVRGDALRGPRVGFLFGGQGSHLPGMGRELVALAAYGEVVADCADWLATHTTWDHGLTEVMFGKRSAELLGQTRYAQPALFVAESALASLWRSWGVEPEAVLGHSSGELAALHVAGAVSLLDALALVVRRAELLEEVSGTRGTTATVFAGEEQVRAALAALPNGPRVQVAAVNSPHELLLAGELEAVMVAEKACAEAGLRLGGTRLPHAPHSALVEQAVAPLRSAADAVTWTTPRATVVSSTTGEALSVVTADYVARQLRAQVHVPRAAAGLAALGCDVLLDLSPRPVLLLLARQSWKGDRIEWVASFDGEDRERGRLVEAAARLYTAGVDLDLAGLHGDRRRVPLPGYPFERQPKPGTARAAARNSATRPVSAEPLIGDTVPSASPLQTPVPATISTAQVVQFVLDRLADYLEAEPESIDASATFLDAGADSLALMRIANSLRETFGVELGIGRFFDDLDSVQAVAAYVASSPERRVEPQAFPASIPSSVDPGEVADRGALSDLVHAQLEVMRRQLELMAGASAPPAPTLVATPAARAPSAVPAVARAVPSASDAAALAHVADLVRRFRERTPGSLAAARTGRGHRVDTRMRSVRPETRAGCYPIVATHASGAHLTDVDGNEYVDLAMGFGVLLCGHDPDFVVAAVKESLTRGLSVGPVADGADDVVRDLCELTGHDRAFLTVSGTDAVRGALRVASAATGRTRFVMFAGSYHGQDDRVLAIADPAGDEFAAVPMAPGISPSAAADALVLRYGSERALRVIEEHAHQLAGVLVEPVQSRNPSLQPRDFLRRLRELTRRVGVPLVFDEVITGFRVAPGGAQEYFGVRADIAAYGKCIGGGHPVGVVAGSADYLDTVDGGAWDDGPGTAVHDRTYIGSTFEQHPVTVAAVGAMIAHLRDQGPELQRRLNTRTADFLARLQAVLDERGAPIMVVGFGSLFRFTWKGNASYAHQPLAIEAFHFHLLVRGVYLWEGRTCFLSTAHTDEDLDAVLSAVVDAADEMADVGFFDDVPTVPAQDALLALGMAEPGTPQWLVADSLDLAGPLDAVRLSDVVQGVLARHDALALRFPGGAPRRRRVPHPGLQFVELGGASPDSWLREALAVGVDVDSGPLVRAVLLRRGRQDHRLVLIGHHLVLDGISVAVLLEEIAALWRGEVLAPAPTFADHARRVARRDIAADRQWWVEYLAGLQGPGGPMSKPGTGGRVAQVLDKTRTAELEQAARDLAATPFQLLLAAHIAVLHARRGLTDVVVGVPLAARDAESDHVVGYCAEMLPVRCQVNPDVSLADHVRYVRRSFLDSLDHARPLADLVDLLPFPARPFPFQTVVNLDVTVPTPDLDGLKVDFAAVPARAAMVDLRVDLVGWGTNMLLTVDHRLDAVTEAEATAWGHDLNEVLSLLARHPERILGQLWEGRS